MWSKTYIFEYVDQDLLCINEFKLKKYSFAILELVASSIV